MQSVLNILTPEQLQAIAQTYDGVSAWASGYVNIIGEAVSIVIEDVMI